MKKDYQKIAKFILEQVGGEKNVISLNHCVTRLRFKLKDETIVKTKELESYDGVISVIVKGGQYQIVIGNEVNAVYQAILDISNINKNGNSPQATEEKKTIGQKFVSLITEVFTPLLGVLCATGLLKGFSILFVGVGLITQDSGTFQILQIIGDSLLLFAPVFLGYTAAKKFGLNEFVGMAIGTCLIPPTLTELMNNSSLYTIFNNTMFESTVNTTFLGMPVLLMKYSSSIIPIIVAVFVASKVEKFFKRIIPQFLKMFLVPGLTLLVVVPFTLVFIGPIGTFLAEMISGATLYISSFSETLTGLFMGGLFQVFVMVGLHYALIPIRINNIAVLGYDTILAPTLAPIFATAGVLLAIYLKSKDKKLKSITLPAFISALFGVTEPALYGITMARKKALLFPIIGGAVGGAVMGFFGSKTYVQGGLGLLALPSYIGDSGFDRAFMGALIGILVAFVVGFVLTYSLGYETKKSKDVLAPLKGVVVPLSEVKDQVFAGGSMGKGVAIHPTEGKVYAPFDATVTALFPTLHAIGLTGKDGLEVLIHVGIDTVDLNGKYFSTLVEQGEMVKQGQLLLEFDANGIENDGYDTTTMIIFTSLSAEAKVDVIDHASVDCQDILVKLTNY